MAGQIITDYFGSNNKPKQTVNPQNSLTNQYNLYNAGVKQNSQNYDEIMQGYRNLLNSPSSNNMVNQGFQPYQPQQYQTNTKYQPVNVDQVIAKYKPADYKYQQTAENANAIKNLSNLASTGGYSDQDKSDLRERGISPIRAVYANAQRNINRSRALQGGYSPNYVAAASKSAREMSDQIANQTTNVNAGIAQNVAQNKLNIAPAYSNATGNQEAEQNKYGAKNIQNQNDALKYNADAMNAITQHNIDALNDANKFNIGENNRVGMFNAGNQTEANKYNSSGPMNFKLQGNQQDIQRQLEALRGMQGLYGTTPGLSQLFGNQAMNSAQFQNLINQQNRTNGLNLISGVR